MISNKKATSNTSSSSKTSIAAAGAIAAAGVAMSSKDEKISTNDCPPDVEELGRSTWTLLHSIAATYPDKPTVSQQQHLSQFISSFSYLYPCFYCADDFRDYISKEKVKVTNRDEFGKWLCDAHNAVNVKLGKPKFDCNLWKERWKDGWKDGRCD
jgi:FAD-linked sulfhydryl oxidase